jgi:hypothetical protein
MGSVWRLEHWPSGTVLRCLALGGERMADWIHSARGVANELAKQGKAGRIIAEGRKGWERYFRQARMLSQTYEIGVME